MIGKGRPFGQELLLLLSASDINLMGHKCSLSAFTNPGIERGKQKKWLLAALFGSKVLSSGAGMRDVPLASRVKDVKLRIRNKPLFLPVLDP